MSVSRVFDIDAISADSDVEDTVKLITQFVLDLPADVDLTPGAQLAQAR